MPLVRRLVLGTSVVAPWTLILILAGAFQIYRAAYTDAVIFLVPATVLAAEALGLLDSISFSSPRPRRIVVAAVAALLGLVLVVAPRHSVSDALVLLAIAVGILPLAWSGRGTGLGARAVAIRRSAVLWACIGVATCLWEVTSFVLGSPSDAAAQDHPTISILLDPVVEYPPGRALFVAVWIVGGVGLLRLWRRP